MYCLRVAKALFTFSLAGVHVARVLSIARLVCLHVILARALFTFELDCLHVVAALSTFGSVAFHLACVFLMFPKQCGLDGLHVARVLFMFGLVVVHIQFSVDLVYLWLGPCLLLGWLE